MPRAVHSRPTPARVRIIPASLSPPRAVNRTTASAPRRSASSTWATWTTSGWGSPGLAEADSSRASEVVGANAGSASPSQPLDTTQNVRAPPHHALGHHDDVGPAGHHLGGAGGDAGQRLQERRRGYAVVEGADDRHPGPRDHPPEAPRSAQRR